MQTKLSAGANSIQTNIGELATGIYTLQIFENNKITQVSKIEKK
jgi:X-X-X-Leu-X-X-Gly heptad repeat protein